MIQQMELSKQPENEREKNRKVKRKMLWSQLAKQHARESFVNIC